MTKDYNDIWVFLSHSNEDYEKVRIVRNYLEEKQYRPIMFYLKCLNDEEEVNDLIKREIDSRNRFILCDSKNAKKSKWVKTEVDYIKSKERMYQVIDLEKSIESIKRQIDTFIFRSSVFVSYSHEDEKLAKSIIKELKKHDFRIIEPEILTSGSLMVSLTKNIEEASKGIKTAIYALNGDGSPYRDCNDLVGTKVSLSFLSQSYQGLPSYSTLDYFQYVFMINEHQAPKPINSIVR